MDRSGEPPAKKFRQLGNGDENNSAGYQLGDLNWKLWDSDQVAHELEKRNLADVAEKFRDHKIVGKDLPQLNEDRLQSMGISNVGQLLQLRQFIENMTGYSTHTKVFNDPIHGHIELHPLCVKIIDTAEFQRLRFIKQLGTCYFVYPGATHNRFEHSIGVCHLAGRLVRALQRRQPELDITDHDILCVELAGLCHDIGHGPFSHLFDGKFIPHVLPETKWKHEDGSRMMLHHLIEKNNLLPVFKEYGLDEKDILFIEEQVAGANEENSKKDWPYKGRPQKKSFLYEVVANKRNGIDVDKWDYFARDCHMLGIRNNFDHNRFIHFARVIKVDKELQICSRDKEANNLYDMFHTRYTLHRRAYQHRVTKIIDSMLTEAMVKANDYIFFQGKDGPKKMSEAIYDMYALTQMTDNVFFQIYHSTDDNLKEARDILHDIMTRNLYKCFGQTSLNSDQVIKKEQVSEVRDQIVEKMDKDERKNSGFQKEDIVVNVIYLDYGMKDKNPIDNVRFYSKDQPNVAVRVRKDQVSQMLPETFSEQQLQVYLKKPNPTKIEMIKRAFSDWCTEKGYPVSQDGDIRNLEFTPCKQSEDDQHTPDKPTTMTASVSAGKHVSRLSFS